MARLPRLGASIGTLSPMVGHLPQGEAQRSRLRDEMAPWRRWYKTARWQKLRWSVLVRDNFTCQCGCGTVVADTSQLVCDHVRPHRGDPEKFWNGPFQTLWKPHHDSWKQALEHSQGGWVKSLDGSSL
ncbi:HNH endonuclease [Phreatobacter sp.]|uniref:HNH endonuclease n=1 Tax=Phreatobacter sp. TaxID=1966341 RepID=UPI003F7190CE